MNRKARRHPASGCTSGTLQTASSRGSILFTTGLFQLRSSMTMHPNHQLSSIDMFDAPHPASASFRIALPSRLAPQGK